MELKDILAHLINGGKELHKDQLKDVLEQEIIDKYHYFIFTESIYFSMTGVKESKKLSKAIVGSPTSEEVKFLDTDEVFSLGFLVGVKEDDGLDLVRLSIKYEKEVEQNITLSMLFDRLKGEFSYEQTISNIIVTIEEEVFPFKARLFEFIYHSNLKLQDTILNLLDSYLYVAGNFVDMFNHNLNMYLNKIIEVSEPLLFSRVNKN